MKKIQTPIAVLAMIFLILSILITSFQAAIYADQEYKYYEKEYEKYDVTSDLDMEMTDVMKVTKHMMAYLIGDEEELSIVTTIEGRPQDFFNEQDRAHMVDVKNLFIKGLHLRTGCLIIFLALLLVLVTGKTEWKRIIPNAYFAALIIFLGASGVIGALFASDFTKYFTIFHEIFFTNDLWMFDPSTDYMIRMLPEGFFSDMVARIGITFIVALLIVGIICLVWKKAYKKTYNKSL